MGARRRVQQGTAAWVFGSVFAAFIFTAYFMRTDGALPPFKERILAVICSAMLGFFGYFFTGSILINKGSTLSPLGQVGVQGSGGMALFVLTLVFWMSPIAPASHGTVVPSVPISGLTVFVNGARGRVEARRGEKLQVRAEWQYSDVSDDQVKDLLRSNKIRMTWGTDAPLNILHPGFFPTAEEVVYKEAPEYPTSETLPIPDSAGSGPYKIWLEAKVGEQLRPVYSNVVYVDIIK